MGLLILALVLFLATHLVPAMTGIRASLVQRFGENGYKVLFSVLSLATLAFLVWGYVQAPRVDVWTPPIWTRHVATLLMAVAMVVLMGAFFPGRIKQVLKHPMLVAIKIWALAHLLANGDLASMLLFGGFMAYAVMDRIMQKGKAERAPVGAPAGPHNDKIAVVAGLALYFAIVFFLHKWVIGVPVLL
jgi:uncharacterized membrane protein